MFSTMLTLFFPSLRLHFPPLSAAAALQVRDAYLHTNCLATLANMAPHMTNVHPACAERLMALLRILSRKLNKLCREVTPQPPQQQQQSQVRGMDEAMMAKTVPIVCNHFFISPQKQLARIESSTCSVVE
jgi:hypothetical protein